MAKAKYVLAGAVTQLIPKSISHITFNYLVGVQKIPPEEIRKTFWYMEPFGPGLPPTDDWVCDLGIPAALFIAGWFTGKESLKDAAFGAFLTGAATFLHDLINRLPALMGWMGGGT